MKEKINRYVPIIIIVAAACVTVPRMAAAFAMVEPDFMGIKTAWVTGPGYGVLAMASAVYSLATYQERKQLKLAKWVLIGWMAILVIASLILLPGMVVQVRRSILADVLPFPLDALWCALLALSPEILVGVSALAFALKRDESKAKRKPPQAVPQPPQPVALSCPRCGATSGKDGRPFRRMQQVSAHMRWCSEEESDG